CGRWSYVLLPIRGGRIMLSRRALVGRLAAGAAVALTATAGTAKVARGKTRLTSAAAPGRDEAPGMPGPGAPPAGEGSAAAAPSQHAVVDAGPEPSAAPPWPWLQPLAVGSEVSAGWQVAELSGVVDGACVLTLRNARGRTQRVHLCHNDGRPQGLVY